MAPLPSTIAVTFTSHFAGDHRICWRLLPNTVYDCSTVVTCAGGGATCTASIAVMLENEACDPSTFDGYVQASCEDVLSLEGRVYFSDIFTPNPECDSYTVTCNTVGVGFISIGFAGTGYNPYAPVAINITGGGGTGATATTIVDGTINLTNAGTGYTNGSYVNIPIINVIGTGTGGLIDVTIAGGSITSYSRTNGQQGDSCYFPSDTFTLTDPSLGAGTGIEFQFFFDYGTVTGATLTAPGSGYTSAPAVAIDPPDCGSGVQATAIAELAPCPNQTAGNSCDGSAPDVITNLALGESAHVCMKTLPTVLPDYTIVLNGCCYDCKSVTFTGPGNGGTTIYYTDCITHEITSVVVAPTTSVTICVVDTSWWWTPSTQAVTVVVGASC